MMTKQVFQRMLMAAMVVVIGMGMGSCTDNIDNSTTPSEKEQQAAAQQARAEKFWDVVSQLVDIDDYTDDYEDMTFEPVYGLEGSEAGTRYVYTNDMATAAARFADLVERDDIDENTQTYTYDDPDVGKLVYTKGTGRILATVEVSIKQIPSLKKIVYVPGAYANATFNYKAYYRFGDVVMRPVDGYGGEKVTEYWICVRPSFGPEGKGDSHWVCLNVLPKKNVWHYYSDNSKLDYYLPTKLGTNKEHMQNLAEMLYAIYYPTEWFENINQYANNVFNLKMFNDFDPGKVRYHNQHFWKNVQEGWKGFNMLYYALNYDEGEEAFKDLLKESSLHFLHKGYSWWTKSSWICTVYDAAYFNSTNEQYRDPQFYNMHNTFFEDITHDMRTLPVDFRKAGQIDSEKYLDFFGEYEPYRWVVRHATGKELATGGSYKVNQAIPGVMEFYRYYSCYPQDDPDGQPEVTPAP